MSIDETEILDDFEQLLVDVAQNFEHLAGRVAWSPGAALDDYTERLVRIGTLADKIHEARTAPPAPEPSPTPANGAPPPPPSPTPAPPASSPTPPPAADEGQTAPPAGTITDQ